MRLSARLLTETGIAWLALGVAALHVAHVNFFQPESGTSAADHPETEMDGGARAQISRSSTGTRSSPVAHESRQSAAPSSPVNRECRP